MVFSLLNLAPDAVHHLSSMLKSDEGESSLERKTAASSAKRESRTVWVEVGVVRGGLRPGAGEPESRLGWRDGQETTD